MSADKIEAAQLAYNKAFGRAHIANVMGHASGNWLDVLWGNADVAFDALIAAVRADEREQAVARFKKLPSDWGQMAGDAIVEAIRNA